MSIHQEKENNLLTKKQCSSPEQVSGTKENQNKINQKFLFFRPHDYAVMISSYIKHKIHYNLYKWRKHWKCKYSRKSDSSMIITSREHKTRWPSG